MSKVSKTPQVSVIIPVYNCEQYIQRCLDSLYAQTFTDFEVIAVNDGSSDSSLSILKESAKQHSNLLVIDQTNHGQGYARNRALEKAKGAYVLFIDSDDFIEPLTLELAMTRAANDQSEVVHFDWKFSSLLPDRPDTFLYLNKEPYAHKAMLQGSECDELLQMTHFFSVNNLYLKSFLDKHNIKYGEGYIYEDVKFMMQIANKAQRISLLHSPLYVVQRNMNSTTRSGFKDDKHYKSFIKAMEESLSVLDPRTKYTNYYIVKYFQTKFIFYYTKRVPLRLRLRFLKAYVDLMSDLDIRIPNNGLPERIMRLCIEKDVFRQKKYGLFQMIILYKTRALPLQDKVKHRLRKTKSKLRSKSYYQQQFEKPVVKDTILFLGFDSRYTGNSRYLYEQLLADKRFEGRKVRFVTDDELVDPSKRVSPGSQECLDLTARSEIIIAESWIPSAIKKRKDAYWLQLWHGTPLKKLLFDSHEAEIMSKRNDHKTKKYKDVLRWDYLLADSRAGAEKFSSSFLYPSNRIIRAGYPRVKYLIDNVSNDTVKSDIKKKIGLDNQLQSKKLVLYAPTWRDYNYEKPAEEHDYDYVLDINKFAESLGDEYLVLFHDHHFLAQQSGVLHERCINVTEYETQELLLIADCLVTDYSSVLFDAFPIGLPVVIYATDTKKYSNSRGLYPDMWKDLSKFTTTSLEQTAAMVKSGSDQKQYALIRNKYCYEPQVDLLDFMHDIRPDKVKRTW